MYMPSKPFTLNTRHLLQPEGLLLLAAIGVLGITLWHNVQAVTDASPMQQASLNPQPQEPTRGDGVVNNGVMLDFDPFARRASTPVSVAKSAPAPSRLDLKIDGIVYLPQRGGGVVMLRDGAETRVLGEGDEVSRGARIVEISSTEVTIDNNGRRETAAIQRPEGGTGSTALQARRNFSRYVQALRADDHED
jgi:type II secretory pathway component PulC